MGVEEILHESREDLAQERVRRGFFPSLHSFDPPSWMGQPKRGDKLYPFFRDQQLLLSFGKVVWGHIVQANSLLFEPGEDDSMAAVIFSEDDYFDTHLEELGELAHRIYELKANPPSDPELVEIGDIVRSETAIAINHALPLGLTGGRGVYFTSAVVPRKVLPNRCITYTWFPYLVMPEKTEASMILPCSYWPHEFCMAWCNPDEE